MITHAAIVALLCPTGANAQPAGQTFYISFDAGSANADFAAGDGASKLIEPLGDRAVDGIRGSGILQRPGDRLTYAMPGNMDSSEGTFSVWVKPLNWDGHSGKFRHLLVGDGGPEYRMLAYLYPIGDEAVINYLQLDSKTPQEVTYRPGAPVDMLVEGEWLHLVTTWGPREMAMFANGVRVAEGLVSAPLPKLDAGTFTVCAIEYWKHEKWSDPNEQTICDEVRIFGRQLADDEVLDLYAMDAPGGVPGLEPKLVVALQPDYFAKTIHVTARPAHLDDAWRRRFDDGAEIGVTLRAPNGDEVASATVTRDENTTAMNVPQWLDGEYVAEARAEGDGATLTASSSIVKPPTPWLPRNTEWRADHVSDPWTPLERDGDTIRCWGREVTLDGGLPSQITSQGQALLAAPITVRSAAAATWSDPTVVDDEEHRVEVSGDGQLGEFTLSYNALMEFDGLVRCDITMAPPTGGADLDSLTIEIPVRTDVAKRYRNPTCQDWDGEPLDEAEFIPYAWLGDEERGLAWFMESDENWVPVDGQRAMTIRREGDTTVARLHIIVEPTRVEQELTYTIGFDATPVRQLPSDMYKHRLASGPYMKGVNQIVYGWRHQISYLNGRLIAHDPDDQRAFVDKWREKGIETRSYSCTQCTSNLSPEYLFFGREWDLPGGPTFSGYKRVPDEAPYSMVPVCPRSSFADFLVWCVREHLENDWGGGIYTDIDGAFACGNLSHGCGYEDAFGRTGRTRALYAHRSLSRRIYEACHEFGTLYYAHDHSKWHAPFNAFNDGWCPGEQYSHAAVEDPAFYMDGIPDRVWRTEFYSPATGVMSFLLPELGRLAATDALEDRGPSECCIAAAMTYGAPLWAGSINKEVVEEVWAAQIAFGLEDAKFVPYWKQTEFATDAPEVRVSQWTKPGARLISVANFGDEDQPVTLTCKSVGVAYEPAWLAADLESEDGVASLTVPAKRGVLIVATGLPTEE